MRLPGVYEIPSCICALEPESMHSQEVMDENDAFLGRAAAEGCEDKFFAALLASGTVMEYDRTDVMDIPSA